MERFRKGGSVHHWADTDDEGLNETREQVKDVYYAGTSDGIVFLPHGQVRNLRDRDHTADQHDERYE